MLNTEEIFTCVRLSLNSTYSMYISLQVRLRLLLLRLLIRLIILLLLIRPPPPPPARSSSSSSFPGSIPGLILILLLILLLILRLDPRPHPPPPPSSLDLAFIPRLTVDSFHCAFSPIALLYIN